MERPKQWAPVKHRDWLFRNALTSWADLRLPEAATNLRLGSPHFRLRRSAVATVLYKILPGLTSDASLEDVLERARDHDAVVELINASFVDGCDLLHRVRQVGGVDVDDCLDDKHGGVSHWRLECWLPAMRDFFENCSPQLMCELFNVAAEDGDDVSMQEIGEMLSIFKANALDKNTFTLGEASGLKYEADGSKALATLLNSSFFEEQPETHIMRISEGFDLQSTFANVDADDFTRFLPNLTWSACHVDIQAIASIMASFCHSKPEVAVGTQALYVKNMNSLEFLSGVRLFAEFLLAAARQNGWLAVGEAVVCATADNIQKSHLLNRLDRLEVLRFVQGFRKDLEFQNRASHNVVNIPTGFVVGWIVAGVCWSSWRSGALETAFLALLENSNVFKPKFVEGLPRAPKRSLQEFEADFCA